MRRGVKEHQTPFPRVLECRVSLLRDQLRRTIERIGTQGEEEVCLSEICTRKPSRSKETTVRPFRHTPRGPTQQPWYSSQYHSLPEVYVQNASLEIAWSRVVFESRTIAGHVLMPFFTKDYEGFDLNSDYDWNIAEQLVRSGQARLPSILQAPYPLEEYAE